MPEIDPDLVPILAIAATAVFVVVVVVLAIRAQRRQLSRLEPLFEPGSLRVRRFSGAVEGRMRGYPVRYAVQQRSQYSPGGAALRIGAITPSTWSAHAEGVFSRAMARLGLAGDLELGDPLLDERLRFSAASTSGLLSALGTDAARAALARLSSGEGFRSLRVRGDRVDLRWAPYDRSRDLELESVRERATAALDLVVAAGYPPRVGGT